MDLIPSRGQWSAIGLAAALLVLPACSGSESGSSASSPTPSATESGASASAGAPALTELHNYFFTPGEFATVLQAQSILTAECMDRFGFDFPVPVFADEVSRLRDSEAEANTRLYGITNEDDARKYGYQLASAVEAVDEPLLEDRSEAYSLVLFAGKLPGEYGDEQPTSPGEVDGEPIPPGGCLGEAWKNIAGTVNGLGDRPQPGRSLWIESSATAQTDSRWREIVNEWVSCMAQGGHRVTDVLNDQGDIKATQQRAYGTPAPPNEISLALADIECKRSVDLVDRLNALDREYAAKAVEDNQLMLSEERDRLDNLLKKAAAVVGDEADDVS